MLSEDTQTFKPTDLFASLEGRGGFFNELSKEFQS